MKSLPLSSEPLKRRVEFSPVDLRGIVSVYSIRIGDDLSNEYQKFLIMFRSSQDEYLMDDFFEIIESIAKVSETGAKERFFRPEGSLNDRVVAIPLATRPRDRTRHGSLRLYCIRVSENLLILGGGGEKRTATYEGETVLLGAVETLQAVDKELFKLEREGKNIEEDIMNITLYID